MSSPGLPPERVSLGLIYLNPTNMKWMIILGGRIRQLIGKALPSSMIHPIRDPRGRVLFGCSTRPLRIMHPTMRLAVKALQLARPKRPTGAHVDRPNRFIESVDLLMRLRLETDD